MKKKILVVDDDTDILDAIKTILEDSGYSVKISEKGEYAENLIHGDSNLPDLIILDVLLSGKDGRQICKLLKNHHKTSDIPILMISAHPDVDTSTRAAGANDFLPKPFHISDLLNAVERLISN